MEEIVFASEEEKNRLLGTVSLAMETYPLDILRLILEKLDKKYLMVMSFINKYFASVVCDDKFWLKQIRDSFGLDRYYLDMVKGINTYCGVYRKMLTISDLAIKQLVKADVRKRRTKMIDQEIWKVQSQLDDTGYNVAKLERKLLTLFRKRDNCMLHVKYRETSFKVNDNMLTFLREANFGLINPNEPTSRPIKQMLSVFENGTADNPTMMSLFNIYIYINKLKQTDPSGYIYITVTDEMKKYFHDSFLIARNDPTRTRRFRNAFKGENIPYGAIHSIISDNIEKYYDYNHSNDSRLSFDNDLLKGVLKVYRGQ